MWVEETKVGNFKFRERYKDPITGKFKTVSLTYENNSRHTQKKAARELNQKIDDILERLEQEKRELEEGKKYTLGELVELYLESKKQQWKESTYITQNSNCNALIKKLGEDYIIDDKNIIEIDRDMSFMSNNSLTMFKLLCGWAYKKDLISVNIPLKLTPRKIEKSKDESVLYYEREEFQKIINDVEKYYQRTNEIKYFFLKRLIIILVNTGMRIGEVLALDIKAIDFNTKTIKIRKTLSRGILQSPKTKNSNRDITFNEDVEIAFREILEYKKENNINYKLLFQISIDIKKMFSQYNLAYKKINPNGNGFHMFRKTHASLLAEMKIPLSFIKKRLGHEKEEMTEKIYIKITDKVKNEMEETFRELKF